jgi:phospholipase/carboxylesterase
MFDHGPFHVLIAMARMKILAVFLLVLVAGCTAPTEQITRIEARPKAPAQQIEPGAHDLGLGGYRLVNRSVIWRDGKLYVPTAAKSGKPLPLLVWLHGGGGNAESFEFIFPIAEQAGVVFMALDARHNTWDGIDSPFGPDVRFIDVALQYVFERVNIDSESIVLGGLSDGGAYALAIGRSNGDLFTHLIGVAPGSLDPPSEPVGSPKILVAHGERDNVYSAWGSREIIVPHLRRRGYAVEYLEFDGPHWVPEPIAEQLLAWITH